MFLTNIALPVIFHMPLISSNSDQYTRRYEFPTTDYHKHYRTQCFSVLTLCRHDYLIKITELVLVLNMKNEVSIVMQLISKFHINSIPIQKVMLSAIKTIPRKTDRTVTVKN
jgi:hypothetical protein